MVNKNNNILLWAIILPFQAGLIAMLSVTHFSLMSTNVAGHFPRAFREILGHNTEVGLAILMNIIIYFLGALTTAFWVNRYVQNRRLMLVPFSVTLLILLLISTVPMVDSVKLNLLFFTMANQNVFSNFITEGVVKPSQLTGILIDLALNIVKFGVNKTTVLPVIKAQLILIGSFVMGLCVAFWANGSTIFSSFLIAIFVQLLIVWLYFWKGAEK